MNGKHVIELSFGPIGLAVVLVAGLVVYVRVLRGHLDVYARAVDKPWQVATADGWWSWLKAKTQGWRTVILAAIGGLAQVVPLLDTWLPAVKDMPWLSVVDEKTAGIITLVCSFLIPLVHAQGLAKAAVTQPQD